MLKLHPPFSHLIHGIGVDLVNQNRISLLLSKYPFRFSQKILTPWERDFLPDSHQKQTLFLSKRFAAKEAFAKALGTGFGKSLSFHDIEIDHWNSGQPHYRIAKHISERFNIAQTFLSITDETPHIIAFCLIVQASVDQKITD